MVLAQQEEEPAKHTLLYNHKADAGLKGSAAIATSEGASRKQLSFCPTQAQSFAASPTPRQSQCHWWLKATTVPGSLAVIILHSLILFHSPGFLFLSFFPPPEILAEETTLHA